MKAVDASSCFAAHSTADKLRNFHMRIVPSALILSLWCIWPHLGHAAEPTCQDNDPTKLCCTQWKMELSGGKGMLLDNTYDRLIADRNRTDQNNKNWCSHGDQNFCGITFGPPRCEGNPVSNTQEKFREIQQKLQEKCQPKCILWDTVTPNGQWQCFAYGPSPYGCHSPPIAHPADGGRKG